MLLGRKIGDRECRRSRVHYAKTIEGLGYCDSETAYVAGVFGNTVFMG